MNHLFHIGERICREVYYFSVVVCAPLCTFLEPKNSRNEIFISSILDTHIHSKLSTKVQKAEGKMMTPADDRGGMHFVLPSALREHGNEP